MTQFHIKISFHILLLLYYYYYNLQQKCCDTSPWVDTYGFPLLLLLNVGATIADKNIVTLAECQLYHFSSPPSTKKVLLLYELQNIPPTICDKNVDPCSLLVLWGILCYSNNNCTFLTYIDWGGGGGEGAEMLVSQCFLCSIVTVFQFKTVHSNVVSHDPTL